MSNQGERLSTGELQVDFTVSAHEILLAAVERQFTPQMPPAFIGKPLNHLYLYFWRDADHREEALEVGILDGIGLEGLLAEGFFVDKPQGVFSYYQQQVSEIGRTIIASETDFARAIPVQAISARWSILDEDGLVVSEEAESHVPNPKREWLERARRFGAEVLAYVKSDKFEIVPDLSGLSDRPVGVVHHNLSFIMSPTLPLNGYEGSAFLREYRNLMSVGEQKALIELIRSNAVAGSDDKRLRLKQVIEMYREAEHRAEELLKRSPKD